MTEHVLQGVPPVPLVVRRSARARRITLRVSGVDGRVTVTFPNATAIEDALDFAQQKAEWIRGHLSTQRSVETVGFGSDLPVDGIARRIVPGAGRSVVLSEGEIAVPGHGSLVGKRVQAWMKTRARDRMSAFADIYTKALGRSYTAISLRDPRSRWGSCTSAGRLMFSWRICMAPAEVQAYLVAHEVAHLAEMNHSHRFWAKVEQLYGAEYDAPRLWLRDNGTDLHRFRFGD